jgi:osmotically-inducible protein OsmY
MSQLVASRNAHPQDADDLYELESEVQRQMEGRVQDFRLVREDRGLVLSGQTSSYYMKQLAQEMVRQFSGLPITANRIAVRKLT